MPNIKLLFKKLLSFLIYYPGIFSRNIKDVPSNSVFIFMYHRILPLNLSKNFVQPGLYVEPITFCRHLDLLQKYFNVVSLEKAVSCLIDPSNTSNKPLCALTFDDGWSDFYKYAYPSLVSHRLPATIFLPTEYIGTNKSFWTDRLSNHLCISHKNHLIFNNRNFFPINALNKLLDRNNKIEMFIEAFIEFLKPLPVEDIESILSHLSIAHNIKMNDAFQLDRSFLNWDELLEMKHSGLVYYGSHTANHKILTTLKPSEIKAELFNSFNKLISKNLVDPSFIPFCYPNGSYNPATVNIVQEAGYTAAFTTRGGFNTPDSNLFTLKRIGLHQDISSSKALLSYRIGQFL